MIQINFSHDETSWMLENNDILFCFVFKEK